MKKLIQRSISLLLALMIMLAVPVQALADEWNLDDGDVTIKADSGSGQTVSQGSVVDKPDSNPTVTTSSGNANDNKVTIEGNGEANVTVKGDNITVDVNGSVSTGTDENGNGKDVVNVESGSNVEVNINGSLKANDPGASGVEVSGDNANADVNINGSIVVSGSSSNGVEVSGDNANVDVNIDGYIGVAGSGNSGVLVSGDKADVTITGDGQTASNTSGDLADIVTTGSQNAGVTITGDNANVTLKDLDIQSLNGGVGVAIKGDNYQDSHVNLNLDNTYIKTISDSGIDITSDGVHHFVNAETGAEYEFKRYDYTGDGFKDIVDEKAYYYTISSEYFPDYRTEENILDPTKEIAKTEFKVQEDASKRLFVTYTTLNPYWNPNVNVPGQEVYVNTIVYLEAAENMVDVTIDLKNNNTVIVTDNDDASHGDHCVDDGLEMGLKHAGIHVSEDNLIITSADDNNSLDVKVSDPHDCYWSHTNNVTVKYNNASEVPETVENCDNKTVYGTWYPNNDGTGNGYVTWPLYYTCYGHAHQTDLASGAAIGTNGALTYADRYDGNPNNDGAEYVYAGEINPYVPNEGEDLTGSITITGYANVNAEVAQYACNDVHHGGYVVNGNSSDDLPVSSTGYGDNGFAGAAIGTGYGGDLVGKVTLNANSDTTAKSTYGAAIGTGQGGSLLGQINVADNARILKTPIYSTTATPTTVYYYAVYENGVLTEAEKAFGGEQTNTETTTFVLLRKETTEKTTHMETVAANNGAVSLYGAAIGTGAADDVYFKTKGDIAQGASINITGGQVTGIAGTNSAVIGTSNGGDMAGDINISNSLVGYNTKTTVTTVTTETYNAAGIVTGYDKVVTTETERSTGLTANGSAAVVGTGSTGAASGDISISGGAVVLAGASTGAAVGTGSQGALSGDITVTDSRLQRHIDVVTETYTKRNAEDDFVLVGEPAHSVKAVSAGTGVSSVSGAAIGSGWAGNVTGAITVTDSFIDAASTDGAAVGSGNGGSMSNDITITGSAVNAAAENGAAIGTGSGGEMTGAITVTGSTVSAAVKDGAGIGTGYGGNMTGAITVTDSAVTATADNGAGIGTGSGGTMSNDITITNSTVDATADQGAGIGSGWAGGMSGDLTITNSTVNATADNGAAIGTGAGGHLSGAIAITGSIVNAVSTKDTSTGAGIGTGSGGNITNTITITNSTVNATSGNGAAIGTGKSGSLNTELPAEGETEIRADINITGSDVTATSNAGAGIGTGSGGTMDDSHIDISGGTVYATSVTGAGIGTGSGANLKGDITIRDKAKVTAYSTNASAIGTGNGATTLVRAANEAENGAYVVATGNQTVDYYVDGVPYHKLTKAELKEIAAAKKLALKKNIPYAGPTQYDLELPTISILDRSVVKTWLGEEDPGLEGYTLIGVAVKDESVNPTQTGFNHVYNLGKKALINGTRNASRTWLADFMNLNGKNLTGGIGEPDETMGRIIYWVTEHDNLAILMDHDDDWDGSTLTVVAEQDDAAFNTTAWGLQTLSDWGIDTIVFQSGDTISVFSVSEALAQLTGDLVVYHIDGEASMTLNGETVENILEPLAN